jgi:hypothetical protein
VRSAATPPLAGDFGHVAPIRTDKHTNTVLRTDAIRLHSVSVVVLSLLYERATSALLSANDGERRTGCEPDRRDVHQR